MSHKPRIMYIECKEDGLSGHARIGRVRFSKTGVTLYYGNQRFQSLWGGGGHKANYLDVDTCEEYWISGCKRDGGDRLYPGLIEIDDDVREEYWTEIRERPDLIERGTIKCKGKYNKRMPK